MAPRRAFALAVTGLVIIAGIAFLASSSSGAIYVYVRDAPTGWRHLNVTFSDIQVHQAQAGNDSGWVSLPLYTPTIDFVALGNLAQLLALDRAVPGKYTQLRIFVDAADGVLADGTPVVLTVPDRVLKTVTPFNVTGGGAVSVTLDFDLAASLHQAGGDTWIFRPVLGAIQIS